jgi:copper chaperone CopZ
MRTAHLTIAGMTAVHAVRAVYTAFAGVPGIVRADVSLGRASVTHDGTVTRAALEEAVAVAGFAVTDYREERSLPTL